MLGLGNKATHGHECFMKTEIHVDSSYEEVATAVVALEIFLEKTVLEDLEKIKLSLALGEILNNIVEHGYQGEAGHAIGVSFIVDSQIMTIEIVDDSPFHDGHALFADALIPNPLDLPESGWGMGIVKQSVDDMKIEHKQGRNFTTLIKKIEKTVCKEN